jgi:phage tail tape-measure protein
MWLKNYPHEHPFEQIVGYSALLNLAEPASSALLEDEKWGKGLVGFIAEFFRMQVQWDKNRTIDKKNIDRLSLYIEDNAETAAWLKRNQIQDKLARLNTTSIGPLLFLPYHYS